MKNKSLSVARPAIFSISVFGKNAYNILFLNILTLSLNSGRARMFFLWAWEELNRPISSDLWWALPDLREL